MVVGGLPALLRLLSEIKTLYAFYASEVRRTRLETCIQTDRGCILTCRRLGLEMHFVSWPVNANANAAVVGRARLQTRFDFWAAAVVAVVVAAIVCGCGYTCEKRSSCGLL